jgi:DNA gyrase subunit A
MQMLADIDEDTVDMLRQLRRHHRRAGRAAGALPEPAGQRQPGHRGRHGHQHPAAQPRRGLLALVDGVPRTLPIGAFVRYWVEHQIEVVVRRTQYRLKRAMERMHILRALLKALDALDEVIALIRASESADAAKSGLMTLLDIDEEQAQAILDMQLRRLAALERQRLIDEHDELARRIADYEDILATPGRQRAIVSEELAEIVDKYGDDRRSQIVPFDGDMSMEDLIPQEDVVVTITRGGYAKRTAVTAYRSQKRGGKGVRGAQLRGDDIVEHFFVSTTHHWLLFFTNFGRVYRAKAYELPEGSRDAKGQHVANLLAFQSDERIAAVLALENYEVQPYLVLATKAGLVKKTRLVEYDSPRSGGLIAVNLRDGDELVGARVCDAADDLLLVSRGGQALRIHADDDTLRPMGRATSGVTGMKFRARDTLLAMSLIPHDEDPDVFVVFENGLAKRTPASDYPVKGRAGLGVRAAAVSERGGDLVGALTVAEDDEVMVVMEKGKIVRSRADGVRRTGRNTMGVQFAKPDPGDAIVAVARNAESEDDDDPAADEPGSAGPNASAEPADSHVGSVTEQDGEAPADDADGTVTGSSADDGGEQ